MMSRVLHWELNARYIKVFARESKARSLSNKVDKAETGPFSMFRAMFWSRPDCRMARM